MSSSKPHTAIVALAPTTGGSTQRGSNLEHGGRFERPYHYPRCFEIRPADQRLLSGRCLPASDLHGESGSMDPR